MLSLYDFSNSWVIAVGLNAVLLAIVWLLPKKLLTAWGIFNAWLLGVLIWGTLGFRGYVIVCVYFVVGSGVTRIGMEQNELPKSVPVLEVQKTFGVQLSPQLYVLLG